MIIDVWRGRAYNAMMCVEVSRQHLEVSPYFSLCETGVSLVSIVLCTSFKLALGPLGNSVLAAHRSVGMLGLEMCGTALSCFMCLGSQPCAANTFTY